MGPTIQPYRHMSPLSFSPSLGVRPNGDDTDNRGGGSVAIGYNDAIGPTVGPPMCVYTCKYYVLDDPGGVHGVF